MTELTSEQISAVAGGSSRYRATLRFIGAGARFGCPAGFAIGVGIEVYLQLR